MRQISAVLPYSLILAAMLEPASAKENSMAGVWRGKLGDAEITACRHENEDVWAYYHDRQPKLILLEGNKDDFVQQETGERWRKLKQAGQQLQGETLDANGKIRPLRLHRVAAKPDEPQGCDSNAFHDRLEAAASLSMENLRQYAGHPYRRITLRLAPSFSDQRIELMGPEAGLAAINRQLLAGQKNASSPYLSESMSNCWRRVNGSYFSGGYFEGEMELIFWRNDYLAVRQTESGHCAGPGPHESSSSRVWNSRSGEQSNPWHWFKGLEQQRDFNADRLPPALRIYLQKNLATLNQNPECLPTLRNNSSYGIVLREQGVLISTNLPAGADAGCNTEATFKLRQLVPFLNQQGLQILQQLYGK